MNIKIHYSGSDFHPKVYVGENPDISLGVAIVGSSNLSEGGLKNNVEANIVVINSNDGPVFSEIKGYFNHLWNESSAQS